jgi:hypothetical protein
MLDDDSQHRHGRACPGHLRLACCKKKDVDARDKRGHDAEGVVQLA